MASIRKRLESLEYQQWAYLDARDHGHAVYDGAGTLDDLADRLREHIAPKYAGKLPVNMVGRAAEKAAARVLEVAAAPTPGGGG